MNQSSSRALTATIDTDPPSDPVDVAARYQREVLALSDLLYRRARRLTRSHADAEDLLQETLMYAYAGFAGFEPGSNLQGWLYRIMHNRWISDYRRSQRRPAESLTGGDADGAPASKAPWPEHVSAEEQALSRTLDDDVEAALTALPGRYRVPLYYATVEGYSYREIATMLGIPVGTAMSRVHRGRLRMRGLLVARERTPSAHVRGWE
jgi:RNA polymerase sigma-70 factor (ECF subfamily)